MSDSRKRFVVGGTVLSILFFALMLTGTFIIRGDVLHLDWKSPVISGLSIVYFVLLVLSGVLSFVFMFKAREHGVKKPADKRELTRGKLVAMSILPGLAHLRLRKYTIFWYFAAGYLAIVFLICLLIYTDIPNGSLISSVICLPILMLLLSTADADYQATLLGLPYTNEMDTPVNNYRAVYRGIILGSAAMAIFIIILVCNVVYGELLTSDFISILCWCLLAFIGWILVGKYRNVKASDLPECDVAFLSEEEKKTPKTFSSLPPKEKKKRIILIIVWAVLSAAIIGFSVYRFVVV